MGLDKYLERKLNVRQAFLDEHFNHLFENDLLKSIHDKIPNDASSRTKLLVNSLNSIKDQCDHEFLYEFIVVVEIIFNYSKGNSDKFSSEQITIMDLLVQGYNHNLPEKEQIFVDYNVLKDKNGNFGVIKKEKFSSEDIVQTLIENEEYKKLL